MPAANLVVLFLLAWQSRSAPSAAAPADERAQSSVEVQEWSVWVTAPTQDAFNSSRIYPNAMPRNVGTTRPGQGDDPGRTPPASSYPIAPLSLVALFGEATNDLDIEYRVEKGTLLSYWPVGKATGPRVRYFGSSVMARPDASVPMAAFSAAHPFNTFRDRLPSLYVRNGNSLERFLAFDSELTHPIPLKIRGGPDRYVLQNLTRNPLRDVAVVAPTESGFRVGWIDSLPSAVVQETDGKEDRKKGGGPPPTTPADPAKAAADLLAAAEAKSEPDTPKPSPLPAEADATVQARVDQLLSRPVQVQVENEPLTSVVEQIAGAARVRVEIDTVSLRAADVDPARPTRLAAAGLTGREALAEVLSNAGLSYRVTAAGSLYITTAARLAEGAGGSDVLVEGPPTEVGLSLPLRADDSSYTALTRDVHNRRLLEAGLRDEMATLLLDQYAKSLYQPGELIVMAHLAPEAIDEATVLDVFPPPRKIRRIALLVIHGIDPRLQDQARQLVRRLGDPSPQAREMAESQLLALGTSVVPALQDALLDPDAEIVYRAERLLLQLGQRVP